MLKLYVRAMDRFNVAKKFFSHKEEGASLVEYGLLVALIALACIVALTALGTQLAAMFNYITTKLPSS